VLIFMKTAPSMMTDLAIQEISKKYYKTNIKEIYPIYKQLKERNIIDIEDYLNKVLEYLKDPPFLGEYKLLLCYTDKFTELYFNKLLNLIIEFVKKREDSKNYTIVILSENKRFLTLTKGMFFSEIEILNIGNPPDWLFNNYLIKQLPLGISTGAASKLKNKLKYNFNLLDFYIMKLQTLNKYITEIDIKQNIKIDKQENLFILIKYIFGYVSLDVVLINIQKYKYANKFLYKYINEKLDLILKLKKAYIKGELNLSNANEYKKRENIEDSVELYLELFVFKISMKLLFFIKSILLEYKNKSIYEFLLIMGSFWKGDLYDRKC